LFSILENGENTVVHCTAIIPQAASQANTKALGRPSRTTTPSTRVPSPRFTERLTNAKIKCAYPVPQVGVTIFTLVVEYWLYGEDREPGMVAIVGATTSAAVIVFAMFFIDRQDARRQPTIEIAPDDEWVILSDAIETFCGLKLTPKGFLLHLVRHFSVPSTFVARKDLDEDGCEVINVAVRDTMWRIIDAQISKEDAVMHLVDSVKPYSLRTYEANYLLMSAEHYLLGLKG